MAEGPDPVAENARLRAANARQREVIARQTAELEAANARIGVLETRLGAAMAQVAELSGQVAELRARLGRNASNSSVPPSSEGLRKKPAQPRRRGARKPGKQPGAEGRHLAQTATPDEVVTHVPQVCGGCGAGLADAPVVGQVVRQTFDLPPIRLVAVEHRAQRRRCCCRKVTTATFPEGVSAPAVYGPGVRALIAYLGAYQHLPVDRCAQLLEDVLGAAVSTGAVAAVLAEAAGRVAPAVAEIRRLLAAAPVVCFDETGARVAGRLHWCHSASTDDLTAYHVDAKRGCDAMDAAGVLPAFAGVAVHDCWSPYRRYDVDHQLCGAHILRELAAAAEQGEDWAEYLAQTLHCAKRWADQARAGGADALPAAQQAAIRARYNGHVEQGLAAHPPASPGRKSRRPKAAALVERLDRYRDDVLRFMTDLAVPFDNNLAERDIRMVKLQLKVSGCWRTLQGARAFAAVRSYISTARKQDVNVLHALRRAFEGDPWLPAATGPPASLSAAA